VVDVIQVTVSAEGDVSDFDATAQQNLVSNMAATVDVQDSSVTLTVSSGSVNLQFDIAAHSTEEALSVQTKINSKMSDATAASQLLSGAGTSQVNIILLSAPVVHVIHPGGGADNTTMLIVGLTLGVVFGGLLVLAGVLAGFKLARKGEAQPIMKHDATVVKEVTGPV